MMMKNGEVDPGGWSGDDKIAISEDQLIQPGMGHTIEVPLGDTDIVVWPEATYKKSRPSASQNTLF